MLICVDCLVLRAKYRLWVRTQLLIATDNARDVDSVQAMLRFALDGNVILYGPFEICRMITLMDSPGTYIHQCCIIQYALSV
jgi:hypothetical protein